MALHVIGQHDGLGEIEHLPEPVAQAAGRGAPDQREGAKEPPRMAQQAELGGGEPQRMFRRLEHVKGLRRLGDLFLAHQMLWPGAADRSGHDRDPLRPERRDLALDEGIGGAGVFAGEVEEGAGHPWASCISASKLFACRRPRVSRIRLLS